MNAGLECRVNCAESICGKEDDALVVLQDAKQGYVGQKKISLYGVAPQKTRDKLTGHQKIPLYIIVRSLLHENLCFVE